MHGSTLIGSLLANDSDPDGDSISWHGVVVSPAHGTLSSTGNPAYKIYNPQPGYVGTDSFTYRIHDSFWNLSNTATVTINVVNNPPTATNDSYTVRGSTLIGSLVANDSDSDGDSFSFYDIVTGPTHGTLQSTANPAYRLYNPHQGYAGTDSFTYRIRDSLSSISNTATVTLNVVNNSPAANADFFIVSAGSGTVIGPLKENDFDPDGDTIGNPSVVVAPSNGFLSSTANPDFRWYTPNAGFTGTDTFQYRITDSLGLSSDATVYVLVLPSGVPPPKVPYGRCPSDPSCLTFNPESGGSGSTTGGPAGGSGPSWPDPVNLASGRETFAPPPELPVYNPTGPSVVWGAHYFADQALKPLTGYGSPGLTRGWVHNYDIRVQAAGGSWGALTLHYPNGSTETLTPVLSGGVPTGAFNTVAGAPYFVTGVAGSPTGTWQSVTITWKDQTKWKFTQHSGTTTYALNQITNRTGQSLNFNWNSSRALTQVSDAGSSTVLLTLAYAAGGKLSTVTDAYNRQVSYLFTTAGATTPTTLQSVSQVVTAGTTSPPARWTYTYASDKGQQLNTVTVPSPTGTGNSTATINYNSIGKVTSLVDANGNQRVYTYNTGTTQVQIKNAANNVG